jgi:hypothetical protein
VTYERIRNLPSNGVAEQILWEVSPEVTYTVGPDYDKVRKTAYVVTSATVAYSGPETYIFPANKDGEILSWLELPGSYRGGLNHEQAIANVGSDLA